MVSFLYEMEIGSKQHQREAYEEEKRLESSLKSMLCLV